MQHLPLINYQQHPYTYHPHYISQVLSDSQCTEYQTTSDNESWIKSDSNSSIEQFSESDIDFDLPEDIESPKPWCQLRTELKAVLPANESYTYLVEHYKKLPQSEFCGAPVFNFEANLRVNLENEMQEEHGLLKRLSSVNALTE